MSVAKPRRAFGVINSNIVRDPSVSTSAKALYALLCSYADDAGECWPSRFTLAAGLGVTDRTIKTLLAELIGKGVIVREDRFTDEGRQTTSITTLVDTSTRTVADDPLGGVADDPLGGVAGFAQNKTSRNKTSRNISLSPPTPSRFDDWYALYPKKVGPRASRTQWDKAVKDGVDQQVLIDALRAQITAYPDKDRKFWKDPERWLSGRRWEDEVENPHAYLNQYDNGEPYVCPTVIVNGRAVLREGLR